jgi:hypothetical protein
MRGFRDGSDQLGSSAASILASRYPAHIVPDLRIERVEELQFVDGRVCREVAVRAVDPSLSATCHGL